MKKLLFTAPALLMSALLATTSVAGENGQCLHHQGAQEQKGPQGEALRQGPVPEAQIELMQKRAEAKKRRDELLKVREQNVAAEEVEAPPAEQK